MYCANCGTQNSDDANFCHACGQKIIFFLSNTSPIKQPTIQNELIYAGFWKRFAAAFMDGIVMLGIYVSLAIVISSLVSIEKINDELSYLIFTAISASYFTLMESGKKCSTYGKRLFGLKVLDQKDSARVTRLQAFSRWLYHAISNITLFIGYLIQPFTQKNKPYTTLWLKLS